MRAGAHERRPAFLAELCPGFILESAACAVHTPPVLERTRPSLLQLRQQGLRLLQVSGVKALGEPAVNRGEQVMRLLALTLLLPEAAQAHGGPQLQGLCLLAAGNLQGLLKTHVGRLLIGEALPEEKLAFEPRHLCLTESYRHVV